MLLEMKENVKRSWFFHRTVQPGHGRFARYVKLRVAHVPGMLGMFSPSPRDSNPDMHHDTCVTHVPWDLPGTLTSGFLWSRWQGKRSQHSRRMRNPQFYVSGKRPMSSWYSGICSLNVGCSGGHWEYADRGTVDEREIIWKTLCGENRSALQVSTWTSQVFGRNYFYVSDHEIEINILFLSNRLCPCSDTDKVVLMPILMSITDLDWCLLKWVKKLRRPERDSIMTSWQCFPHSWLSLGNSLVTGIHRSLVDSPHKGPVIRSFDVFFV